MWLHNIIIITLLTFGTIGEPSALARRHRKHRPLPSAATLVLPAPLMPAAVGPSWAVPAVMFHDALYPTPNNLGLMGFAVTMMMMRMAHDTPNPSKPLLIPIPMFSEGGIGIAIFGRF